MAYVGYKWFQENHQNILDDIILQASKDEAIQFIYSTGSLIENRANPMSDLDVVIVRGSHGKNNENESSVTHVNSGNVKTCSIIVKDGYPVDIETHVESKFARIFRSITNACENIQSNKTVPNVLCNGYRNDEVFTIAHRFYMGDILYGNKKYNEIGSLSSLSDLAKLQLHYRKNMVDRSYEDVAGRYEAGEYADSAFEAHIMLRNIMAGIVNLHGRTIDKDKWILRYANEIATTEPLVIQCIELLGEGWSDSASLGFYVERVLNLSDRFFKATEVRT